MKLIIIGQGGHSKVICDLIHHQKQAAIIAFLDDQHPFIHEQNGLLFGPVQAALPLIRRFPEARLIIAIGNNAVRRKIVQQLNMPSAQYATLIHETAIVSPSAIIGSGSVIMAHCTINADAKIGHHAIINTGAIIEHDSFVGDYVHISPGAVLTGAVKVEEGVHIGAGATVIPNLTIGEWSVIGAGATVTEQIPAYRIAVGVPAKLKDKRLKEGV